MIDKIHAFFNRGKKQTDWKENEFIPTITVNANEVKPTFNEVYENTIKK